MKRSFMFRAAHALLGAGGMKHYLSLVSALALVFVVSCSSSEEEEQNDPAAAQGAPVPGASGTPGTGAPNPGAPGTPGAPTPPAPTSTPSSPSNAGAFAGAPAYAAKLGPSTIDTSGKGNGHLSFNVTGNPAGKPCLSCHDGAGKGGAPAFVFAGTLFADKAGTKPAVSAEVRLLGADGKGLSAYTDANGNFFFRAGAAVATPPAIAGARNATVARTMLNKINDANCNECHGTSARLTL